MKEGLCEGKKEGRKERRKERRKEGKKEGRMCYGQCHSLCMHFLKLNYIKSHVLAGFLTIGWPSLRTTTNYRLPYSGYY
jgi:hypothetical protein